MKLAIVGFVVLLINIPFGYWRDSVKKFSLQWFLAVHLPVPLIVLLRIYSELGFSLISYPVLVGCFFLGQFIGAKIHKKRIAEKASSVS